MCALTLRMTLRDARALRAWAKARGKALAPLLVQAGLREASDYERAEKALEVRVTCPECGGSRGDVPPCGCGPELRARMADEERFEQPERLVSVASQERIRDDVQAVRALYGVLETTREERIEALRHGPQTRQTMAMRIVLLRCAAVSREEARRER